MTSYDTDLAPTLVDPLLDGGHERLTHIVLEGFKPSEDEFVPVGNSVVAGMINNTPVKALCGKVWIPKNDPHRYPLCPTCKEIAQSKGWSVPAH